MTKLQPAKHRHKVTLPNKLKLPVTCATLQAQLDKQYASTVGKNTARVLTVSFSEVTKVEMFGVRPVRLGACLCFGSRK